MGERAEAEGTARAKAPGRSAPACSGKNAVGVGGRGGTGGGAGGYGGLGGVVDWAERGADEWEDRKGTEDKEGGAKSLRSPRAHRWGSCGYESVSPTRKNVRELGPRSLPCPRCLEQEQAQSRHPITRLLNE